MLSENNTLQELNRDKLHAVKMAVVKSMEYIRGALIQGIFRGPFIFTM